jgi:hypothetical protein
MPNRPVSTGRRLLVADARCNDPIRTKLLSKDDGEFDGSSKQNPAKDQSSAR